MRGPENISNSAWHWIKSDTGTARDLLAELVKMLILSVPPVKRSLVYAVMSITNGFMPNFKPKQTIEDPNIKEEMLFRIEDAFNYGEIQLIEGETAEEIMEEFQELTERQALGMVCGCALLCEADNLKWDDVFVIDDEQDTSKHTTDALDI